MPKYVNIEHCEEEYKAIANTHSKLCNICCTIDVNDDIKFNDNTFFKLFVYNEYISDIFNTNKEQHFKKILINNGFVIEEVYKTALLNKTNKTLLIENKTELKKKTFSEHVENVKANELIEATTYFLNLHDKETQTKYYDVITDKYKMEDYLNLIRYFTKPTIIKGKVERINKKNVEYKAIYMNNNKILLVNELENELKINKLDVSKLPVDKIYKVNDELIKKINTAFRCETKPETYNEYIDYYVNKLKSIFGHINLIQGTRKQVNKVRSFQYNISEDVIKYFFDLHYYSSPFRETLDDYLLKKYGNVIKIKENDIFIDETEEEMNEEDKAIEDKSTKTFWTCRFCTFKDYEESCIFFNDMQCVKCTKNVTS